MKIESTAFGPSELHSFLNELRDRERRLLLDRLAAADRRLEALRPRLVDGPQGGAGEDWTAHEVLAHMAVLSKFYGVVAYRIATGRFTEFDLLGQVQLRDVAGEAAAAETAASLLDSMAADHARTAGFLNSADLDDLYREAGTGLPGLAMTAIEVLRLPLIGHLEGHLEQLESALG